MESLSARWTSTHLVKAEVDHQSSDMDVTATHCALVFSFLISLHTFPSHPSFLPHLSSTRSPRRRSVLQPAGTSSRRLLGWLGTSAPLQWQHSSLLRCRLLTAGVAISNYGTSFCRVTGEVVHLHVLTEGQSSVLGSQTFPSEAV